MAIELEKNYDPAEVEPRIYKLWKESGIFNPDNLPGERTKSYTIIMPPPNVTGILHMGHALMLTIEDIMIRFKRMQGFKTLWLPGTDHAAIASQAVVEKELHKKESKSRYDLGREEFLKRVNDFVSEKQRTILAQMRTMGCSCDWSRLAYTLDEPRSLAVRTIFKKMYDDGLIYRGNRVVNWDPKGQTTISDDEIVYEERSAKLYTFKYSKDFPIPIATTRPETKLGDTGVAVHPDGKYKKYIGQEFSADFCGEKLNIKVVGDESVDQEFGTGAVGLTPAHSMIDWEIAQRHGLPAKQIINEYARMTVGGEAIKDKKTTEARETVVAWLREQGLLEKEEDIKQNVATAERTGGIVEPLPKLQWFLNVNKEISGRGKTLKEIMREPVAGGKIKIMPEHYEKIYFHWIDNLRDWCISRQIWFGHRIPVWYWNEEIYCGIEGPTGDGWEQDPDTLDTWFSSGLWTFSTLGWPEKTKDLAVYHPTDVLETGTDILFFWVARMILMAGYALDDIPFHTIYLHGLVRDAKGQKFSKSLGNGIDPMDVAKKFGTDAGRMALIIGNTAGTDLRLSEDKIKGYKNFANKLWNIARFILAQENTGQIDDVLKKEFDTLAKDITMDMENYRFYLAAEKIYHYVWHRLADELIEKSKSKKEMTGTLYYILENSLKLLHPFMPFITEEIYGKLPSPTGGANKQLLMIESWPT
ncbi:MAG: valine--tRNA ligase [Candidatus Yanofskybacteria bacterium RIFCSPLOWO2_02_FULL_47_9b]|uniref:Valine--tRNA ligase n=1 Tax=Candidatus Yanofskybacteria bacterium RIFCSPLOWO2_02_FULL_47_9b TaxID=1802708 RepID=A0A1F8H561_9BACT|nr:MAG: valine--tRNA ligase [Candidatus Yanofskybacteria bacterium RIFCSPLOWO2_02_FULL_47_9b]